MNSEMAYWKGFIQINPWDFVETTQKQIKANKFSSLAFSAKKWNSDYFINDVLQFKAF